VTREMPRDVRIRIAVIALELDPALTVARAARRTVRHGMRCAGSTYTRGEA
jgi:hypothetical protein